MFQHVCVMSTIDHAEREKGDNLIQRLGINTDVY